MKKFLSVFGIAAVLLFSTLAMAKDHGFITGLYKAAPADGVFQVNIEKIDGKDTMSGVNKEVKAGTRSIEVSLVFNPAWGTGMNMTEENIYYQTISVDVEAGKTYTLAAKVNTHASSEQQKDGSFWEAIIYKTH
jgi:hypothetical protein